MQGIIAFFYWRGLAQSLDHSAVIKSQIIMKENPQKHAIAKESQEDRITNYGLTNNSQAYSKLLEFFIGELQDIYWAETKLVETLPKMAAAATTEKLRAAFTDHLTVTQKHLARLEMAFSYLGETAQGKKCEAMSGIVEEGEVIMSETEEGSVTRDVGLILAGQKVEHYEIATYGALKQLAQTLNLREVAGLMQATLTEEKEADSLLTIIAESGINYSASEE